MLISELQQRSDMVRIPAIRMAIALSLALHVTLTLLFSLGWLPRVMPEPPQGEGVEAFHGTLRTRIAPLTIPSAPAAPAEARRAEPAGAPPAQAAQPLNPERKSARVARAAPPARARPEPPVKAPPGPPVLARQAPAAPQVAASTPAVSSPPAPAMPDFSAALEARQRARGQAPASAAQSNPLAGEADPDAARRAAAVAANLSSIKAPSPGESNRRGGGIFQVRRLGIEEAEFLFFGWNPDMRRNNTQTVSVRKGTNASIQLAVVRQMIVIIRQHEQGEFVWQSRRQGRDLTLSARARDNAALEAFLLEEFFG